MIALRTRVWTAGKVLLLVGALVVTYFLFALVGMRAALRAGEVEVPNVVGVPVDAATQQLADVGLTLRLDPNERPDDKFPAGTIVQLFGTGRLPSTSSNAASPPRNRVGTFPLGG